MRLTGFSQDSRDLGRGSEFGQLEIQHPNYDFPRLKTVVKLDHFVGDVIMSQDYRVLGWL